MPATIPSDSFAVYHLDKNGSATGLTCPQPFNVALYSRYKYGWTVAADWFARSLGSSFLAGQPGFAYRPRLLIASSPYRCVPTAAHALAIRLVAILNDARAPHGLPAARLVHIERRAASSGDYGTLSAEARARLMAANGLSFDRLLPYAENAHLIVVDDVKVTGAHQECLTRASDALPLRFPQALGTLDALRAAGLRLAVVSNAAPASEPLLDIHGLRTRVDAVVLSCSIGVLKPDPRIYRVALDALRIDAADAAFVGDGGDNELRGARGLGLRTLLVERGLPHTVAARADATVRCADLAAVARALLPADRADRGAYHLRDDDHDPAPAAPPPLLLIQE